LHGVMSSSGSWWKVGPALAERGWDVAAVDLPGHGDGAPIASPVDPVGALVEGTLPNLGRHLDLLVGHSLGAVVALAAANRYPGLASALLLEDPPGIRGMDRSLFADGVVALREAAVADRDAYWRQSRLSHPLWQDADVDQSVAALIACDAGEVASALRGGLDWDLCELIAGVDVPVMVVLAPEVEGAIPVIQGSALVGEERRALRALLGPGRLVDMEGGHSLHRDRPEEMTEIIDRFAGEVTGSAR
jgi:pimeloyl-ACP methyl ester carboxylesterase